MEHSFTEFKDFFEINGEMWTAYNLDPKTYECGYCGYCVSSDKGMCLSQNTPEMSAYIYICNNCHLPTLIYDIRVYNSSADVINEIYEQIPGARYGEPIKHLPYKVEKIYEEARDSFSTGAYTAVMLLCRKLLMHVAVNLGAEKDKSFLYYVDYFEKEGYISKNAWPWVDQIRKLGNEANHEIMIGKKEDAEKIIKFSAMLLKTNYEYPKEIED